MELARQASEEAGAARRRASQERNRANGGGSTIDVASSKPVVAKDDNKERKKVKFNAGTSIADDLSEDEGPDEEDAHSESTFFIVDGVLFHLCLIVSFRFGSGTV